MYYFNKNATDPYKKRLTIEQIQELGIDLTLSEEELEAQGIYKFYMDKPATYDETIHNITEDINVNEYFEEDRQVTIPVIPFNPMMGNENEMQTTTIRVKGYRIKWILTAKDKDVIKPILLERLAAKKHLVEDAGVKLPDGTVIQSAEADRNRVAQLMLSLVYLKVFNPTDIEFKNYLDSLKFKIVEGVYRPITEDDILFFFKTMAIRTLSCFDRENEISDAIGTAYTANDADAMLKAYFDNIDTGWPS